MKKSTRILAASAAFITAFAFTSCGGTKSSNPGNRSDNDIDIVEEIDNSNGYVAAMAAKAGFNMEHTTPENIMFKFGSPISNNTYFSNKIECIELSYDFGSFNFETRDNEHVLTYMVLNSGFKGEIFGIKMGDSILDTAEKLYSGSKEKIETEMKKSETEETGYVLLYGELKNETFVVPYGLFRVIDVEQYDVSSMYRLEYAVNSETEGVDHLIYFTFNSESKLNEIMIIASDIM